MDHLENSWTAPFYTVPSRQLVSVEHPAIVRNVDKAIETLQGDAGIKSILDSTKDDPKANLVLRPGDALSRPVQSTHVQSNNVLLKVTVPKRTGRKRKLGSNAPFEYEPEPEVAGPPRRTAKDLLRSLSDNPDKYQIEPVGSIEHTHLFRGMPDFVYSTQASSFANRFREQILSFDFDKMKQFDIDMGKGAQKNADIIPPPSFSHGDVPFHYIYRQNPTVKKTVGESGQMETINTSTASKVLTHLVSFDIPTVPDKPRENLLPLESHDQSMRDTIAAVQAMYEQRPIWTRRAIRNNLTSDAQRSNLRHAIPYVGYIFRSGPWRDAIVKLGVDPRTDPEYRHYQTFMFRLFSREAELARDGAGGRRHNLPRLSDIRPEKDTGESDHTEGHVFTGKLPLSTDGRIWMIRDIVDPQLRAALYPENPAPDFLRKECDIVTDGWYGNGTLGKAKTVMRAKIGVMMEGKQPVDKHYVKIMKLPDHARSEEDFELFTVDIETSTSKETALATEVRSTIRGAPMWRQQMVSKDKEKEKEKKKEKQKKKKGKKDKTVEFDTQSEGEEEELERQEMIAAQVAAAAAARDADEANREGEGDDEEDQNDRMDEDEDE